MKYTVNSLHRALGKLIDEGHGRKPVCVAKTTFQDNCEEDGVTILRVAGMGVEWIPNADGDGGAEFNQDGTESGRTTLVLVGNAGANEKGDIVSMTG